MSRIPEFGLPSEQVPEEVTFLEGHEAAAPLVEIVHDSENPNETLRNARADVEAVFADRQPPKTEDTTATAALLVPSTTVKPETKETGRQKTKIRHATEDDLDQLVDLDRSMFAKAYGQAIPESEVVRDMLKRRMENVKNGGGWMHVFKVDDRVEGFVTVFKTRKPWDEFVSWEDSTNGGTLDDMVDHNSKVAYIANLTVAPKGSAHRGRQRLLARAFADGFKDGMEYGYFESRMPGFRKWLESQGIDPSELDNDQLDVIADEYANAKTVRSGKEVSIDPQLRMYDTIAERGQVVPEAFQDDESLNYGVVFRANLPRLPKPLRYAASWALRGVSRSPKIAAKLF